MVRVSSTHKMEECKVEEPTSLQNRAQIPPPLDVKSNNQEASGVDHSTQTVLPRDGIPVPISKINASIGLVKDDSDAEMRDHAHEMVIPQCGVNGVTADNPNVSAHLVEKETASEITDGCIIPVSNFMAMESQCNKSLQGDLNSKPADKTTNRELLLQLLEENQKLKEVVGKVLQWGKQQSGVVHHLTNRVAQLEEQEHPSKLLLGEDGKKIITNCLCPRETMGRSRQRLDKGCRNKR